MVSLQVLIVTAVTNLMVSGTVLYLAWRMAQAPRERYSAAWYWNAMFVLLGTGGVLGGIDHGLYETLAWPRYGIQHLTWIALGAMTFCILMTTATQCFGRRGRSVLLALGAVQFAAALVAFFRFDTFLVVVVNYLPVVLFWLAMNVHGLSRGTGSREMIAGLVILLAGSAIQTLGVDTFSPLDHNGLYHLIAMAGSVYLYRGGRHLKTTVDREP